MRTMKLVLIFIIITVYSDKSNGDQESPSDTTYIASRCVCQSEDLQTQPVGNSNKGPSDKPIDEDFQNYREKSPPKIQGADDTITPINNDPDPKTDNNSSSNDYIYGGLILLIFVTLTALTWIFYFRFGLCVCCTFKAKFKLADIDWMGAEFESKFLRFPALKNIPRRQLSYDDENLVLGQGKFGTVLMGKLFSRSVSSAYRKVAVKKVNSNPNAENYNSLLREMQILSAIPPHKHIVDFIGASTDLLALGETLLVFKLLERGDLKSFFENSSIPKSQFPLEKLMKWGRQIAQGMCFLEEFGVLHLDLSLQNILLDEKLNAKVSDFGLSRLLKDKDVSGTPRFINWRWSAPEVLTGNKELTAKSDVWSFGVTLFELFSPVGRVPYAPISNPQQLINRLLLGYRLHWPERASAETYTLMKTMWAEEPEQRPSFKSILVHLSPSFYQSVIDACGLWISSVRVTTSKQVTDHIGLEPDRSSDPSQIKTVNMVPENQILSIISNVSL